MKLARISSLSPIHLHHSSFLFPPNSFLDKLARPHGSPSRASHKQVTHKREGVGVKVCSRHPLFFGAALIVDSQQNKVIVII